MTEILRPGLLQGVRLSVAGDAAAVRERCAALGAEIAENAPVLVADGAEAFGAGGVEGLRACTDACWDAVLAWLTPEVPRDGKVVLLAPHEGAGDHAAAAGAALENLARTLAVEWARFGVRATAVRPGPHATEAEVAELVGWLVSPGGDYVSGCALAPGMLATG